MKMTTWALMIFTLVLLGHEQATFGSIIEGEIITQEGEFYPDHGDKHPTIIYSGDYKINLFVGNDNLGCTVRVGTKSSDTKLLNISGPLAVRNVIDPLQFFVRIGKDLLRNHFRSLPFKCGTTGTIRVSNPPIVTVPVMVTLTYGPFLKKTYSFLVTQKVGIKSVAASPVRSYYSHNHRVGMTLTPTRKSIRHEDAPPWVYFRVREGRLCKLFPSHELTGYAYSYRAGDGWIRLPDMSDFFEEGKPITQFVNLCHRGRTIVEFGFPDEEIEYWKRQMMNDSRIHRLVFTVPQLGTPRKSPIHSRGIDQLPPAVNPDPEPPALPNFELQGEKP